VQLQLTFAPSLLFPIKAKPENKKTFFIWLRRHSAQLGYLFAGLMIYVGRAGRAESNITAENRFGYFLGIAGVSPVNDIYLIVDWL